MTPSDVYRRWMRGVINIMVWPEQVGLRPDERISYLSMENLEAAFALIGEVCGGAPWEPRKLAPPDYQPLPARRRT